MELCNLFPEIEGNDSLIPCKILTWKLLEYLEPSDRYLCAIISKWFSGLILSWLFHTNTYPPDSIYPIAGFIWYPVISWFTWIILL